MVGKRMVLSALRGKILAEIPFGSKWLPVGPSGAAARMALGLVALGGPDDNVNTGA